MMPFQLKICVTIVGLVGDKAVIGAHIKMVQALEHELECKKRFITVKQAGHAELEAKVA